MCKKTQFKYCPSTIDLCLRKAITRLQSLGVRTLACCCGHGKYPMTIVIDVGFSKTIPSELFSGKEIPRKKKFYKKDKQGYYYIPEVLND